MRTLTVTKLDTSMFEDGLVNLVKRVHWAYGDETKVTGSVKLAPPKKVFTPFDELDESTVLGWIEGKVDIARHNKALDQEMFNASLDTPWSEDFSYEEPEEVTVVRQTYQYKEAVARLAQYILADGREEVTEMRDTTEYVVDDEGMIVLNENDEPTYVQEEVVVQTAVEPLEATVEVTVYDEEDMEAEPTVEIVENPEITQDNLERAEAQATIDNTPVEIKDGETE